MDKAKLIELGVPAELSDEIFNAVSEEFNAQINEGVKKLNESVNFGNELSEKLEKAEKKISGLEEELNTVKTERDDFSDKLDNAHKTHAAEKLFGGYNFSSSLAKEMAIEKFKESKPEFKDGEFVGGKDWIEELKKTDPTAFAEDKPTPKLMTGSGGAAEISDAEIRAVMGLATEGK